MQLIKDSVISQEEGLSNADSANNLMWLLNNDQEQAEVIPEPEPEIIEETSFTEFTLKM